MADDLPRAHVAHRMPGRLRVRVPSRKGDRAYFGRAAQRLGGHHGVRSVRVSPRAASVTIEHDDGGSAEAMARLAREHGLFDLHEAAVAGAIAEAAPARMVCVDPGPAAAMGFAGLGAIQLARGNLLGTGLEHLWQAYGAARTLGDFRLAAAMALLAAVQMWRGRVLSPAASLFFYAAMVADGRRR